MPFIHAHIGVSSITGIHTPEVWSEHHVSKGDSPFLQASKTGDDSIVVTVGTARVAEKDHLYLTATGFPQVFVRLLAVPPAASYTNPWRSLRHRSVLTFYRSESYPPPTLAPPAQSL